MKKNYSAFILLLVMLSSKAQVSGYSFTQFSDTYIAITGGTVFGNTSSDDQRFVNPTIPLGGTGLTGPGIPIGFNLTFNGNVYDRIAINNNGWISLGQSTLAPNPVNMNSSDYNSFILATSTAPAILQNRIGGLGRDLQGQTGSELRVETIGVTPNQTCVVQWSNYRKWGASGDNFNFQIRLTETSNNINIIYGTFTTTTASTAQVGLRGATNTDFNNRNVSVSNPWATSIAGTANSSIVNFNSTLTPPTGQNYQWSPPTPCSGTPNSGVAAISSSTGCPNTNFNLTATGLSNALGLTYQWYSAPTASGPWSAISTATNTSYITNTNTVTFYQLETTCTVSALSASTSATSYTPVGPCYTMANTTITTCSGSLFDSGGQSANYLNNESYTLTLVPSTANAMAQLNFVSFSTESGWDYLYIFDGNSTSSPLVGQYSGSTLPPAITATNSTGILTLRFTSDGSTASSGFEAAISCFIPPTCSGVPNSGTSAISSATGCPNTNFNLSASGLSTGLGISYQWYSAPAASGPWSAIITATNTSYITNTNTVTFYQLETTCSVSAMSATTSVTSYTPVGPCYTMANTTITTCSGSLFDSGGQSANYLNNESYTLTLVPSTANAMAQLNFVSFSTESGWDYLYIFDGNSTSSPLIGQYSGSTLPPAITATNSTGILTLRFTSDGSTAASGFEAAISCYITPTCSGAPNSGTASISSSTGCITDIFNLNASGVSIGTGITFQWYSSLTSSGPWSAINTATNTAFATSASVTTFYQMVTTCSNSALSATTTIVSYTPSNCYTMSNNTIVACGGTIYDSGGSSNDYTSNEDFTLTIVPSAANSSVTLTFNTFMTEAGYDYLDIYDGNSTSDPLLGSYDGNTLPPVTTANNAAGVLTLHFYSDGSFEDVGFDISVTCTSSCSGPPPAPAITTMSICSGNSATLTAAATGTAQWYTTSTASTTPISTNTLFVTPILLINTTYYVRDTSICGASSLVPVSIVVVTTPTLNVSSTNTAICMGQSATLTASSLNTYTWNTTATTSVIFVTPTITTNYTVTGNDLVCNTIQTESISIVVNALPSVSMSASGITTICVTNGSISLTGSPSGGVFSGAAVIGSQLSIANAGTFVPVYSYTDTSTGCSNTATTQVIVIDCGSPAGLVSLVSTSGFNLYPNPNTGIFLIETNTKTNKSISISDITGRIIYSTVSEESSIQININDFANGIYYVKVSANESIHVIKIIKH